MKLKRALCGRPCLQVTVWDLRDGDSPACRAACDADECCRGYALSCFSCEGQPPQPSLFFPSNTQQQTWGSMAYGSKAVSAASQTE